MKDINKRALKCYVETLEKENTMLHDFVAIVHSIVVFDGSNPNKTDKERINEILLLLKNYESLGR